MVEAEAGVPRTVGGVGACDSRGTGCAIVEKFDDQPEEVFPLRLGATSRAGHVALEDGPGSMSKLHNLRKGTGDLNDKYIKRR